MTGRRGLVLAAIVGLATPMLFMASGRTATGDPVNVNCGDVSGLIAAMAGAQPGTEIDLNADNQNPCTYTLTAAYGSYDVSPWGTRSVGLPPVNTPLTINGNASTITRNSTAAAFGILMLSSGGTLDLSGVTISGGALGPYTGARGGGILNVGGKLRLTDSTVSDNSAFAGGGGIASRGAGSVTTLNHTTISGNTTPGVDPNTGQPYNCGQSCNSSGGGILTDGGTLTLIDSTVSGNHSERGGGISFSATYEESVGCVGHYPAVVCPPSVSYPDGKLTLKGGRVTDNTATSSGGGIWSSPYRSPVSLATATDVAFSGNTPDNCAPAGSVLGCEAVAAPTPPEPPNPPSARADRVVNLNCADVSGLIAAMASVGSDTTAEPGLVINLNVDHQDGCTYPLTTCYRQAGGCTGAGLPSVTTALTINGNGSTIVRESAEDFRILVVASKNMPYAGTEGGLTLSDVTLAGGSGDNGGAIASTTSMTLINSTVTGNTGGYGGGIFNFGALTLVNSTVSDNTSTTAGGGIWQGRTQVGFALVGVEDDRSVTTLINSTVSGNRAWGESCDWCPLGGGGILIAGGTVSLTGSSVASNTAEFVGGGISNGGTLTLTDSTVTGNTTSSSTPGGVALGGGIFSGRYYGGRLVDQALERGVLTLSGGSVTDNRASTDGGGIYFAYAGGLPATASAVTFSGNTPNDCAPEGRVLGC